MSGGAHAGRLARAAPALLVALAAASGCTVGSGAGSAMGTLFITGCDESNDWATARTFSLDPTFFAGQPIEDVCRVAETCQGPHMNRLIIQLQRSGNRIEINDTLYFDVTNSLQVARCLRGRTAGGVPDWDTRLVTGPDGASIPGLSWCDWTAVPDGGAPEAGVADAAASDAGAAAPGADGGAPVVMTASSPRINLSTQDYVRASLSPLATCDEAISVGVALPGSWIQFENFGSAEEPSKVAGERDVLSNDFKVEFGERLRATFHLELGDQAVEYAIQNRLAIPPARIGGELDGKFDFDLERGRAAQPFP